MIINRTIHSSVLSDLREPTMVFIAGPRQVGKTTFAQYIGASDFRACQYLNWDDRIDQKRILSKDFDADANLLIFDELHKYSNWKNYIKGLYDKQKNRFSIIVTGSARLDVYRRGGDSLMGRYHNYRLHPFSLAELIERHWTGMPFAELSFPQSTVQTRQIYQQLFRFGGFPKPFLAKNNATLRRFHNERLDRLVKEDIRDIERVHDLSLLQTLINLLPERASTRLSLNSLREDLGVAHKTVAHWMDVFERFYYHFRITPFAAKTSASLRKEPKLYLWDWSEITDIGNRFENMIALHLLKFVHFLYDTQGYRTALHYLRDREGREVDFMVTVDQKPWFAVEAKYSDTDISSSILYYMERTRIPYGYQVVAQEGINSIRDSVHVVSADRFLAGLV